MENGKRKMLVFYRMCQHHSNVGTCSVIWGLKSVSPSCQREVSSQETSFPVLLADGGNVNTRRVTKSSRHYEIKDKKGQGK